jgi:hypothetical protein
MRWKRRSETGDLNARRGRPAFCAWSRSLRTEFGDAPLGELRVKHQALGYPVDCRRDILSGVQKLPATAV